ncbi:MAG: exopolyphosphatase, partial [Cyclobacteriaceae bacterium]|nr:exopolyphosphatase [Cyclobacteriaceae bacterium]
LIIANKMTEEIVYKEKQAVQLGKGGISRGYIASDAMDRAVNSLLSYKTILEEYQVEEVLVAGTSAIRNAQNQQDFIQTILNKTGFEITVISGDEEALLIYQGVSHFLSIGEHPEMIIDIGGGSVEFIIANQYEILWIISLEIGGQRLMDKFHKSDPIDPSDIHRIHAFLRDELSEVIDVCRKYDVKTLIGSAGSFDTLQDIFHLSSDNIEGLDPILPINFFYSICQEFIDKTREERLDIPGMIPMRVDMIVVASLLIKLLVEELQIAQIKVSAYALKEGLLFGKNYKISV